MAMRSMIRPARVGTRAFASGQWISTPSFDTQMVHSAVAPEPASGAVLTPVYLSTTFVQESVENYLAKGFSYSRTANPTVSAYQKKVAEIENGHAAHCFGTGMAATTSAILATMKAGDHCVITDCSYGGTNRIMRVQFEALGMSFDFVDFRDLNAIEKAIKPNTKLIFSESPANPTLSLVDLDAVSALAKKHNALHICDSTFATPVILSLTKYYDGHNITTGGAVISKTQELADKVGLTQNMHGNIMSPMVAFLQLQTSKTMPLRIVLLVCSC